MRRAAPLLLLLLCSVRAFSQLVVPAGGVARGSLAWAPRVSIVPASVGDWGLLQGFARVHGAGLALAQAYLDLDAKAGVYAAGALSAHLPARFWAEVADFDRLPPERRTALLAAFGAAQERAAASAAAAVDGAMPGFEADLAAGRVGLEDLEMFSSVLNGLAPYDPGVRAHAAAVSTTLADQRALLIESSIDQTARALAGRSRRDGLAKTAVYAGYGLLGVSAAALLNPAVPVDPDTLTWAGLALTSAGKFLRSPKGPSVAAPRPSQPEAGKTPGRLGGSFASFQALWRAAQGALRTHERFEASVGGGSWASFKTWLASGLRAALYLFPISLAGMAAGAALTVPLKWLLPAVAAPAAAGAPGSLLHYVTPEILLETVFLGVGFNALLWAARTMRVPRAKLAAGLGTLALFIPMMLALGIPLLPAVTMAGIEAVLIYAYARSGTLLIPVAIRAMVALIGADSARMLAALKAVASGELVGLPDWTSAAVAAGSVAVFALWAAATQKPAGWSFLKAGAKAQAERLRSLGAWWSTPASDGAPKSFFPALALGLMWAVPTYFLMDLAYRGVHFMVPQAEPTPELLRRVLLMPVDVVIYNFIIVAALEEWVFRRGVFKPMVERLKKWGAPSKWWFWPAAVASSVIFSGAHYVDWSAILARVGVGNPDVGASLAGAYAFTWASFTARALGGVLLSFLYARSGLLLVPMIAHFGSNFLESIGVRWGLAAFLSAVAAIFVLQLFSRRPPEV